MVFKKDINKGVWVLFTTSNSLLSKIIRTVTGCKYSHAALIIDGRCYEAQKDGIIEFGVDLYQQKNPGYNVVDAFKPNFIFDKDILKIFCKRNVFVTKYDFKSLLKHIVYKTTGYWRKNKKDNRMTCSEFVANAFFTASYGSEFKNYYKMSPANLYNSKKFEFVKKYND